MYGEEGKTGVINVFLSGTLAEALENYHAIKAGLDVDHAYELEDKFFVTSNMKPIQLQGYTRWAVVIEMCKVMEVQSITFTRNRHAVATRMSAVDAKGDSGMQHSEETRKDYYDDMNEAQGIRNKILTNSELLEKSCNLPANEKHREWLKEKHDLDVDFIKKTHKNKQVKTCIDQDMH